MRIGDRAHRETKLGRVGTRGVFMLVLACVPASIGAPPWATAGALSVDESHKADELMVVDCLLPAQVRQLGGRMTYLEARKATLESELVAAPLPLPRLHPNLAELYRRKVANLHAELNRRETRTEAAEMLRDLIDEIRLVPEDGELAIELRGDLAAILALSRKNPQGDASGAQITLVAGARNHRNLTLCVEV